MGGGVDDVVASSAAAGIIARAASVPLEGCDAFCAASTATCSASASEEGLLLLLVLLALVVPCASALRVPCGMMLLLLLERDIAP